MSSVITTHLAAYRYNRTKTLGLLDQIEKDGNQEVLGWRPGPGRAHVAWQLMHIGITEELFATERLNPNKAGEFTHLWSRYRFGSTPDDDVPSLETIRDLLKRTRSSLEATLSAYDDSRLGEIPAALKERGLTVLDAMHLISWHESHHHGQSHITYNLFKNRSPG